jgi:hypothetical protein
MMDGILEEIGRLFLFCSSPHFGNVSPTAFDQQQEDAVVKAFLPSDSAYWPDKYSSIFFSTSR